MSSSFGVHFISTMVRWGGGRVIQRWCYVYTTYRCQGNGVRTREQLPWRLTTTTTYKNHQGNRENICKKEMMNQKKKHEQNEVMKSYPPPCGREEAMWQITIYINLQVPADNNLASTFRKHTTYTNQKGWQRSTHKSRKCQKLIWY